MECWEIKRSITPTLHYSKIDNKLSIRFFKAPKNPPTLMKHQFQPHKSQQLNSQPFLHFEVL